MPPDLIMVLDEKEHLKYKVGGLLYAPAVNRKVPDKVEKGNFPA